MYFKGLKKSLFVTFLRVIFLLLPSSQLNSNDVILDMLYKYFSIIIKKYCETLEQQQINYFFLSCSGLCWIVLSIVLFLLDQSETMECLHVSKDQLVLSFLLKTYGVWKELYTGINSGPLRWQKYGPEVAATDWDLKISFLLLAPPVAGQFTYCLSALLPSHVKLFSHFATRMTVKVIPIAVQCMEK